MATVPATASMPIPMSHKSYRDRGRSRALRLFSPAQCTHRDTRPHSGCFPAGRRQDLQLLTCTWNRLQNSTALQPCSALTPNVYCNTEQRNIHATGHHPELSLKARLSHVTIDRMSVLPASSISRSYHVLVSYLLGAGRPAGAPPCCGKSPTVAFSTMFNTCTKHHKK